MARVQWRRTIGDADKAMASVTTKIEAIYQVPFLAHATMEPMNCTVHLRKDGCEIWIGSQAMARVQAMAAKAAGLPPEKVIVHNHLIGGGFGRRLEADGAVRAVEIAKHVDGPVKVVWTREEDIQHDMYRPWICSRATSTFPRAARRIRPRGAAERRFERRQRGATAATSRDKFRSVKP